MKLQEDTMQYLEYYKLMLDKFMAYPMEVIIAWAVSAKNALHNSNGCSLNQLVFGQNPNIPSVLNDEAPALEMKTSIEIVAKNFNAIHA